MKIDMGETMSLTEVKWNDAAEGEHRLTFVGTEPNPTTLIFNSNTAALRLLRKPFEVQDLWMLRVHMKLILPGIGDQEIQKWVDVGIFSTWKAAKQRLEDMVARGEPITNDPEGKAWDIKRWDLEH